MKTACHTDYLSGPEKAAVGFTAASVDKSGRVAWHNCRERQRAAAVPTAMAQALIAAGVKK